MDGAEELANSQFSVGSAGSLVVGALRLIERVPEPPLTVDVAFSNWISFVEKAPLGLLGGARTKRRPTPDSPARNVRVRVEEEPHPTLERQRGTSASAQAKAEAQAQADAAQKRITQRAQATIRQQRCRQRKRQAKADAAQKQETQRAQARIRQQQYRQRKRQRQRETDARAYMEEQRLRAPPPAPDGESLFEAELRVAALEAIVKDHKDQRQ